jgi:hypothetical protein
MKLNLNYLFLASLFFLNSCSSNVPVPESKLATNKTIDSTRSSRPCTKEDLTGIWELYAQVCDFPKHGESPLNYKNSCKPKESISDFYYPNQFLIFNQDNDDRAGFVSATGKKLDMEKALDTLRMSKMANKSAEQFVPKDQLVFKVDQDGVLSNIPGFPADCLCTFIKKQGVETITLQFYKTKWGSSPPDHMKMFFKVKNL